MASRKLSDLHPRLQLIAKEHIVKCKEEGIDLLIYCTYRSTEEQKKLYAQGRTEKGSKVTWTLNSKHNHTKDGLPCSLAYDCVPLINGKPAWSNNALYHIVGKIGESLGLIWGYHFKNSDMPHFEMNEG